MALPPLPPRQANTRIGLAHEIYPFTTTSKEENWGCDQCAEELDNRLPVHVVKNVGGGGRGTYPVERHGECAPSKGDFGGYTQVAATQRVYRYTLPNVRGGTQGREWDWWGRALPRGVEGVPALDWWGPELGVF